MMRYEQILNKIAPAFFKFVQLNIDIYNLNFFIYLYAKGIPGYVYKSINVKDIKNIKYIFQCLWYSRYPNPRHKNVISKLTYDRVVSLTTKDKIKGTDNLDLDGFIVSMVLNKFSFDNEHMLKAPRLSFADLFIVLVGKDLYDAIRTSIK
ncbi:MAG: hypothetical protein RXR31_01675 [Thermoproteota archaeon]